MNQKINRRNFLGKTTTAGIACCGLLMLANEKSIASFLQSMDGDEIIDPVKLNYCGYTCPDDCKFRKATLENDVTLKKEAWKTWKIEENYGLAFDEEKAFCYGCKTHDKPEGVVLAHCTVRSCTMERGLDCCIQCDELTACQKDLWNRFPKFYEAVKEMQIKYNDQKG